MAVYHLLYVSSTVSLLDQKELQQILTSCRRNNSADNITGPLLYKDGNFIRSEGKTDAHLFPDWAMGFHRAEELADLPDFSSFLTDPTP